MKVVLIIVAMEAAMLLVRQLEMQIAAVMSVEVGQHAQLCKNSEFKTTTLNANQRAIIQVFV